MKPSTLPKQPLAAHVLAALARAQVDGRLASLETLVAAVGARRGDVRSTLSQLHREGYLDVLRMRLTLAGFAIGCALLDQTLPALRASRLLAIVAA